MSNTVTFPVKDNHHGSLTCTVDVEVLANHLRPYLGNAGGMRDVPDEDLPPTQGEGGELKKTTRAK